MKSEEAPCWDVFKPFLPYLQDWSLMGKDNFLKEKKNYVSVHTSERNTVCKKPDFMDEATLNVLAYGLMSFYVLNVLENIFAFNEEFVFVTWC